MKSVLITGASRGIGHATALHFLQQGWRVGLLARDAEALETIAQAHPAAVPLPADVTDAGAVEAAFGTFVAAAGRLDVLFNNAGLFTPAAPIDEIPLDDWHRAVNVNLTGMFLCARAAFGQMRRQSPQGGRIINNGSVSAHVPRPGSAPYTATKHAVTGLTRSISLDGRPFSIACGQIDVGNAATDLLQGIADAAVARGEAPPPMIAPALVADAVFRMADLPLHANVQFQTLMATTMPFIGRG